MQSKKMSLLEAITNTTVGFFIAVLTQQIILPWYGFVPTFYESSQIALIFTSVSFLRNYIWRRLFNWMSLKFNKQ